MFNLATQCYYCKLKDEYKLLKEKKVKQEVIYTYYLSHLSTVFSATICSQIKYN